MLGSRRPHNLLDRGREVGDDRHPHGTGNNGDMGGQRSFLEDHAARQVQRTRAADGRLHGRVIAHSSFHHFCDYNWDLGAGAPSFVDDPPGLQVAADRAALDDIKTYVRNAARWLAPAAD